MCKVSRLESKKPAPRVAASSTIAGAIVIASAVLMSYGPLSAQVPVPARVAASPLLPDESKPIQAALTGDKMLQVGGQTLDTAALWRVYGSRDFKPIWTTFWGRGDAQRALDMIAHASEDGLVPERYRLAALKAVSERGDETGFELLMTDAMLRYARDMRFGRVRPESVQDDISLPAEKFDPAIAFAEAANDGRIGSFLEDLAPSVPEYGQLKQALARYRTLAAAGGWQALPAGIKPEGQGAELLRARLRIEDPTVPAASDPNDPMAVVEALMRYQARNGLKPDGKLGKNTVAMLNIPADVRAAQIAANMERWRWMPHELEARRVMVNVADATLRVVEDGRTVLTSKVIVGRPNHRTPMLQAAAKAVTVNPVWHVPPSIATNEILPKLRRNPNYMRDEGMIFVGDRIEQRPGPKNALGTLKLELPNKFNVYLHDTPSRKLFAQDVRTLSHGCVRTEAIQPLASYAWQGDPEGGTEELLQLIASGETKELPLKAPLSVYVLYWTATIDENGTFGFRPDVYGRDKVLMGTLDGEV